MSGLFEKIQRRRLPHWVVVYAATAWGCTEATGFLVDNYGVPHRVLDVVLFLLLVFLFVVIVLVWYHGERGPQAPTRLEGSLIGALLCVAVAGTVWLSTTGASAVEPRTRESVVVADLGEGSLAVLPFRSTVGDAELAWLERGVAELLATNLAQIEGLRVSVEEDAVEDVRLTSLVPAGG